MGHIGSAGFYIQNIMMKKIVFVILSFVVLTACSNKQTEASNSIVESDTIKTVEVASNLPTVLDFSAVWCPPCQQFKPIFEAASKDYTGKVAFRTIDVDQEPELAKKYRISSIPAIVFIDCDGNEVNRIVGFTDRISLDKAIKAYFKVEI